MNDRILLIAGGGKFGKKAIDFAVKNQYIIFVVDSDPNCFAAKLSHIKLENTDMLISSKETFQKGLIYFLNQDVATLYDVLINIELEFVIPVVPIHFMAKMIEVFLFKKSITLKSNKLAEQFAKNAKPDLILNYSAEQGAVYLSYAKIDEICPDNCSGPRDFCPNFKRDKPVTITEYIKDYFKVSDTFKVIKNDLIITFESYQLTSGLGGIRGSDIAEVFSKIKDNLEIFKEKCNIIISTSCNCHGVINFFKNY